MLEVLLGLEEPIAVGGGKVSRASGDIARPDLPLRRVPGGLLRRGGLRRGWGDQRGRTRGGGGGVGKGNVVVHGRAMGKGGAQEGIFRPDDFTLLSEMESGENGIALVVDRPGGLFEKGPGPSHPRKENSHALLSIGTVGEAVGAGGGGFGEAENLLKGVLVGELKGGERVGGEGGPDFAEGAPGVLVVREDVFPERGEERRGDGGVLGGLTCERVLHEPRCDGGSVVALEETVKERGLGELILLRVLPLGLHEVPKFLAMELRVPFVDLGANLFLIHVPVGAVGRNLQVDVGGELGDPVEGVCPEVWVLLSPPDHELEGPVEFLLLGQGEIRARLAVLLEGDVGSLLEVTEEEEGADVVGLEVTVVVEEGDAMLGFDQAFPGPKVDPLEGSQPSNGGRKALRVGGGPVVLNGEEDGSVVEARAASGAKRTGSVEKCMRSKRAMKVVTYHRSLRPRDFPLG